MAAANRRRFGSSPPRIAAVQPPRIAAVAPLPPPRIAAVPPPRIAAVLGATAPSRITDVESCTAGRVILQAHCTRVETGDAVCYHEKQEWRVAARFRMHMCIPWCAICWPVPSYAVSCLSLWVPWFMVVGGLVFYSKIACKFAKP